MNDLVTILANDQVKKQSKDIMFLSAKQIMEILQSSDKVKGHESEVNFVNLYKVRLYHVWNFESKMVIFLSFQTHHFILT